MSFLKRLIEIGSSPTGEDFSPEYDNVPDAVCDILRMKNGFFAFESALEVFPAGPSSISYELIDWNNTSLWIGSYGKYRPDGICFAQDIFGGQFLAKDVIYTFDPETGEVDFFADNVDGWAKRILEDFDVVAGYSIARSWQKKNGPLSYRHRLVPVTPFVLGGDYELENLIAMESAKAMRVRGDLACQIKDAPDGTRVIYRVTP